LIPEDLEQPFSRTHTDLDASHQHIVVPKMTAERSNPSQLVVDAAGAAVVTTFVT